MEINIKSKDLQGEDYKESTNCFKIHPPIINRKRYIIFGYDNYYPSGGQGDEVERVNTEDEYVKITEENKCNYDMYEILDLDTGEWIDL